MARRTLTAAPSHRTGLNHSAQSPGPNVELRESSDEPGPEARVLPPPPPTLVDTLRYLIDEIAWMLLDAYQHAGRIPSAELMGALEAYAALALFISQNPRATDVSRHAPRDQRGQETRPAGSTQVA
jgi:hypothetical protein